MILRFLVPGSSIKAEVELTSSSPAHTVGFIDAFKSACLDLTIEATLLAPDNASSIMFCEQQGTPESLAMAKRIKGVMDEAAAFCTAGTVIVELEYEAEDRKGKERTITVKNALRLPSGAIERLASIAVDQAIEFNRSLVREALFSDDAIKAILAGCEQTELRLNHEHFIAPILPEAQAALDSVKDMLQSASQPATADLVTPAVDPIDFDIDEILPVSKAKQTKGPKQMHA